MQLHAILISSTEREKQSLKKRKQNNYNVHNVGLLIMNKAKYHGTLILKCLCVTIAGWMNKCPAKMSLKMMSP